MTLLEKALEIGNTKIITQSLAMMTGNEVVEVISPEQAESLPSDVRKTLAERGLFAEVFRYDHDVKIAELAQKTIEKELFSAGTLGYDNNSSRFLLTREKAGALSESEKVYLAEKGLFLDKLLFSTNIDVYGAVLEHPDFDITAIKASENDVSCASSTVRYHFAKAGLHLNQLALDDDATVVHAALSHPNVDTSVITWEKVQDKDWLVLSCYAERGLLLDELLFHHDEELVDEVMDHPNLNIQGMDISWRKVSSANSNVRQLFAKNGIFLERLLVDYNVDIAKTVVDHPDFSLDRVKAYWTDNLPALAGRIKDVSPLVKKAIAKAGLLLDTLLFDGNPDVSLEALNAIQANPDRSLSGIYMEWDSVKHADPLVLTAIAKEGLFLNKLAFNANAVVARTAIAHTDFDVSTIDTGLLEISINNNVFSPENEQAILSMLDRDNDSPGM